MVTCLHTCQFLADAETRADNGNRSLKRELVERERMLNELDTLRTEELTEYDELVERFTSLQSDYDELEDSYLRLRMERLNLIKELTQANRAIRDLSIELAQVEVLDNE